MRDRHDSIPAAVDDLQRYIYTLGIKMTAGRIREKIRIEARKVLGRDIVPDT